MRRADIEVPNLPVDMNSWGRSACYPRSTFCLISDGPSTRDRQITKAHFRACSSYISCSQAPFYLYALRAIANRAEGTIALLRYLFGGDRPSQTTHVTLSATRIHGAALGTYHAESGISPLTPPAPRGRLQRLPPILRTTGQAPISHYSEGSRGLSVLMRERGIFTTTTISPSLLLRQSPSRYAIHAGRNLPDKELRYLRTVIVTAAIHRGFDSKLRLR
jgi:hypothetical protein